MTYNGPGEMLEAIKLNNLEEYLTRQIGAISSGSFPLYNIPDLVNDCIKESDKIKVKMAKLERGGWPHFDASLNVDRLNELAAFASAYLKLYMGEVTDDLQDSELCEESPDEG